MCVWQSGPNVSSKSFVLLGPGVSELGHLPEIRKQGVRREKSGQGGIVKGGALAVGFQGVTLSTLGFWSVWASCS